MALTSADKKMVKLVAAVRANPNNNAAWGALAVQAWDVAVSLREMLVARGEMTLAA